MLFSRFLFRQTLKKIEMEFHGFIVLVNDENKFNLLSCLIKGDLISRFDFDFSKTDVQS